LVQKAFTRTLTVLWIKVIFFVGSLFQMVAHHDSVLKKQEVGRSTKLFDLR
jgi:hypothetical protein